jgi:hypothetical protein
VAFSARQIPGNEKAIGRVMNHVARRGADIVAHGEKRIHVSGHGSSEELKMLVSLVRPRFFVPIHGEYRQLARHARMASMVSPQTRTVLAENGDVIRLDAEGVRVVDRVPAGERGVAMGMVSGAWDLGVFAGSLSIAAVVERASLGAGFAMATAFTAMALGGLVLVERRALSARGFE